MGKSSFCDKLAYDWATEKQGPERSSGNSLSNFQVVFLLKCRDIALNIKGRLTSSLFLEMSRTKRNLNLSFGTPLKSSFYL